MNIDNLVITAKRIRKDAIRMIYEGRDGHPGPSLSCADLITYLFFEKMNIKPEDPRWPLRDRFILSKGHACPAFYAALNERGYFSPKVEHFNLRALGSSFQGHPSMTSTPGVDMTSGSLGNGIAIGAGMALSAKIDELGFKTFVIVGDGELQEGVCWEGASIASGHRLDNLFVFVDLNNWQSYKSVVDTVGTNSPADKFRAFGWDVVEADGHDFVSIDTAVHATEKVKEKPHCIVCRCIKGKGVSFMENENSWHKGVPTDEQFAQAMRELGGLE